MGEMDVDGDRGPSHAERLRRRLVLSDAAATAAPWSAVLLLADGRRSPLAAVVWLLAVTAGTLVVTAGQHLYLARVASVRADEVARLGRVALGSTALAVLLADPLDLEVRTPTIAAGGVAVFAALVVVRGRFAARIERARQSGQFLQPVVVVGDGEEAGRLVDLLHECPEAGFRPVGFIGHPSGAPAGAGVPWVGGFANAGAHMRRCGATGVIVTSSCLEPRLLNRLIRDVLDAGFHVHLSSGISGLHRRRIRVRPIAHEPLIYVEAHVLSEAQLAAKRALDVVGASVLLLVLSPVLAVAAAAIKASDGGPVLFRQCRVGRFGEEFSMLKLRTMSVDAEQHLAALGDRNERTGPLFKLADDPRVTRVGRFLRDSSIDEIPQLVNVLRGTMSIVGPRPALPSEVEQFDDELRARMQVKPGLTGLWQVEARAKASFEHYRRLDLFYVENWSLALDLAVILGTVPTVLRRALEATPTRPTRGPEVPATPAVPAHAEVRQ